MSGATVSVWGQSTMFCGSCQHENEPDAKFCGECGSPLGALCPACSADQPAGGKFCNQCGASMAAGASPPAATAAPAAVRKQVTALFADLVGSTAFGDQLDPETARSALAPYFDILRSTIEGHAGTVVKFTGDGVMAIFGVPEIAEDDALRAVAAGAELQRRFESFAARVRDRLGGELGLRVGINTGELVIGDGDEDLVGDVLNTAARLEAACQPGHVLVGEDTWRITRSAVSYEVLGEIRVKGKADAVATFQVVERDRGATTETTPFVGRASELAVLVDAHETAGATSAARLVTIIGAPGVGKTRLAAELRGAVDVRSFDLRFERRGSTTFTPIVELLRELTGTGSAADIAMLVADHSEAERLGDLLASLAGDTEARSTEESFWAVRRLLEHLASQAPLLVVVDDIQWAEPLFWDLLDHLVEWAAAPITLVGLARPELRELRPELTHVGGGVAASISLEGLDADTTRELAARLLDADELPSELVDRLPESTDGNPLFVRELVQMLVDDGVLEREGDQWHLTIDAEAIEVPPTILSLLASRVERLPDDEREVVELASVIGTEFDRGLLSAIASTDLAARIGALIDRLRRKDLVEPSGAWVGDHPVYRFHHVLVRDAAYRRLLKGRRADLHERVGRHLETHGVAGPELDVNVAHHFEQVVHYRGELGTTDDATRALAAVAVERLTTAGRQALEREDLAASGGYAQRALALRPNPGTEAELLALGCEALLSSGNVAEGSALVAQLDRFDGDDRLTAWSDCFRAQLWSLTDASRLRDAADLSDAAADKLDEIDDQSGVAKARLVRANAMARLGQVGECEAELDLALAAARAAGDRRRTVAVLGAAPLAAVWGPSPVARAGGRCLDVLRLLRITTDSPAVEATSVRCQALLEALRGRFDSAREKLESSRVTARELGLRHSVLETELFAGLVELWAGDPSAAEPHLRVASDGLGALGIGADAGQAKAFLASALLRQGRVEEADGLATAAREVAGQNLQTAIASRAVLAEVRSRQQRHDEAQSLAVEAVSLAEPTDVILDHAFALEAAARVAAAGGSGGHHDLRDRASELLAAKGVASAEPHHVVDPSGDAGHEPGGAERAMLGSNTASTVTDRFQTAYAAGDEAAMAALFHPDYSSEMRVPLWAAAGEVDLSAALDMFDEAARQGTDVRSTLLAIRGEDLCLHHYLLVADGGTTERYAVFETRDGLGYRIVWFDETQFDEALVELDRVWVEFGGSAEVATNWRILYDCQRDGDFAPFLATMAPDFEDIDHRSIGKGRRSGEEYCETLAAAIELGISAYLSEVVAAAPGTAIMRVSWTHRDQGLVGGSLVLTTFVIDGLTLGNESFDASDLDDARRRFDAIVALDSADGSRAEPSGVNGDDPLALENHASVIATQAIRAIMAGDGELVESLMGPGFRIEDRRMFGEAHETVDVAHFIARNEIASALAGGVPPVDVTVEAVRGETLALLRHTWVVDGADLSRLCVLESEHGLGRRWAVFETEALSEAANLLDEWWVESGGSEWIARAMVKTRSAIDPDSDVTVRSICADDVIAVDHRALGNGVRSADQLAEMVELLVGNASILARKILVCHRNTAVLWSACRSTDGDVVLDDLHVVRANGDGQWSLYHTYPLDRIEAALAHYDELTTGAAGAVAPKELADGATFVNQAWRLAVATVSAANSRDRDALAELLHRDFTTEARSDSLDNSLIADLDRAAYILAICDGATRDDPRLVAIRGDRLCLAVIPRASGYDDRRDRLVVIRCEDGQMISHVWFEATDLVEAFVELDRQYLRELGFDDDHHFFSALAHSYALDAGGIAARTADDFEYVEHRPLSFSDGGSSALDNAVRSATHDAVVTIPRMHRVVDNGVVYERVETAVGEVGESRKIISLIYEADLLRRLDIYEIDDLDEALTRFDELVRAVAANEAGSVPTNLADRVARRTITAVVERGAEAMAELLPPDFQQTVRRNSAFDTRDSEARVDWLRGEGWSRVDVECLATRGERLVVQRWRFTGDHGWEQVQVQFTEVDDKGRPVRGVLFDESQIDEAMGELDQRWIALGGSPGPSG